ncbi:tetratricopeptide repeat protein [Dactylosporangium sp. NPDC050588]|uniref:tetratricopeptide repeat protein n=1 Tax=Dactylosporangium sp. NPDC050588 TaxID=3157211 RepID=UPI0033DBEBA7
MKTEDELWTLLREADHMPYGSGQIALVEQIVQHADAGGFDELRFAARMQATTAYVHGGETAKSFVTFSWCRAEYDAHPDRFDRHAESLLLWQFKYMVSGLLKFPEVPLGRTHDVLDDMERRFRAGGHSLQAVYSYRHAVAAHIGDPAADEWYEQWCATPRDDNSDCVGCDPTSKVYHLVSAGDDEAAVALAQPVLAGHLTCAEQPQSILTSLLVPYLRTGRLTEAADAHRRAYRSLRGNLADLQRIGEHVVFCARTGNETRGLEIVERHLTWLDKAPHPQADMWFSAAAALLLSRLDATVVITGVPAAERAAPGGAEGLPAPVLAERLAARARALAARFDARNGTANIGRLIEARLHAEPLVDHLPLSAVARTLRTAAVPAATSAPRPLPTDPAELLDRAEELFEEYRFTEARAAWQRFDELVDDPAPALAVRRVEGRGRIASVDEEPEVAEAAFLEAAAGHRRLGDERSALIAEARALLAPDAEDRQEEVLARLTEVTERIVAIGDADTRAEARLRLEYPLLALDRLDDALAAVEAAVAEEPARPALRAELAGRRARCLLVLERFEEAVAAAADCREQYGRLGDPPPVALASLIQGHALANLERFDAAVEAFDAALAAAVERDPRLSALVGRGRARLAGGHPAEAVDDLVEAIADHVAHGEDGPAAILRFDLANAYDQAGQPLDAAEAAESSIDVLDRIGAQEYADRTRYLLSRIYRELDEPDQALALLETLAGNLDGFDNLQSRGRMLQEAAQLLYRADRDAQAAERFGAAAAAFGAAGVVQAELYNRRMRALALRWAGSVEESLAALAEADALAASLSQTVGPSEPWLVWQRAMLDCDAARVLLGAGQGDEALARVRGAADVLRGIGALGEALEADLLHAELLLRSGDPAPAEPLLRSVLGAAPAGSQAGQNAAWMLAEALEAMDRSEEAAEIRQLHLGQ